MSTKYKATTTDGACFIKVTLVGWIDIFTRLTKASGCRVRDRGRHHVQPIARRRAISMNGRIVMIAPARPKKLLNTSNDCAYDAGGNMISDENKGITDISYNHLNLPVEIRMGAINKINYLYNANGEKVMKRIRYALPPPPPPAMYTVSEITTLYLDGFQYFEGILEHFPHDGGYVKATDMGSGAMAYNYAYHIEDHLGNIRVTFAKNPTTSLFEKLEEKPLLPVWTETYEL